MSEREFENYLILVGRLLRLTPAQRDAVADELHDHLQERLEVLTARGVSRDDAVRIALEEFGDAAGLAGEFSEIVRGRKKRWMMRVTTGTIAIPAPSSPALRDQQERDFLAWREREMPSRLRRWRRKMGED